MSDEIIKSIPEDVLSYIKIQYEEYKSISKGRGLTLEDYSIEIYDSAIEIVGLKNKKEMIEKDIAYLENELSEINLKLAEVGSDEKLI